MTRLLSRRRLVVVRIRSGLPSSLRWYARIGDRTRVTIGIWKNDRKRKDAA